MHAESVLLNVTTWTFQTNILDWKFQVWKRLELKNTRNSHNLHNSTRRKFSRKILLRFYWIFIIFSAMLCRNSIRLIKQKFCPGKTKLLLSFYFFSKSIPNTCTFTDRSSQNIYKKTQIPHLCTQNEQLICRLYCIVLYCTLNNWCNQRTHIFSEVNSVYW